LGSGGKAPVLLSRTGGPGSKLRFRSYPRYLPFGGVFHVLRSLDDMRARATEVHEIPDRAPLRIAPGELVDVGAISRDWPAFVYVTGTRGEGWVPARNLSKSAGPATVTIGYDTTELPLVAGQSVTVVERDDESGWWWCRDEVGRQGWVPTSVLTPF